MLERVLIVDDDQAVLAVLSDVLRREGFLVSVAPGARPGLELLERETFDLLLCDIRMNGMDGMTMLREVRRSYPGTDVLMMTGFGSLEQAIDAMALGAVDYLTKPLRPREVVARIRSVMQRRALEVELHSLQSELRSRFDQQHVVAQSPRMMAVLAAINRLSTSDENLLLVGEPGSGRRFLARIVWNSSSRRNEPFHSIDCSLLSADMAEQALFGSIPSPGRARRGHLERLAGGTLHLANFEALPLATQLRLIQALRDRSFQREAESGPVPLRVRLIVSLDAPLDDQLAAGKLVEGCAELRAWIVLHVPPLSARKEDLPDLVNQIISRYEVEHGVRLDPDSEALDTLYEAKLPGNVRQLEAVLSHAATLATEGSLTKDVLLRSLRHVQVGASPSSASIAEHLNDREYQVVLRAVMRYPRRLDQAARELGVSRTTLWRRMRKYDIRVPGSAER
jgi:DNA-binding NtrC family response regulator